MSKVKNVLKDLYQPHRSFVVRNPLFSIDTFFNWQTKCNNLTEAKNILLQSLKKFYRQPIVQEALYIASPDLHHQLELWLENKIEKPEKKERTELSLIKYMIRMCTRCTPYGLFASCSSGDLSEITAIQLSGREDLHRHGRLDMDYVCELHSHLIKQRDITEQLNFSPNTSLYRLGDQLRYIEQRFAKDSGRSYHLVEIDHSAYLEKILKGSINGKKPAELAALITDDEISIEEANEFIYELISSQILIDELAPTVTGEEYFSVLLQKLIRLQHTEKNLECLEKVNHLFNQLKVKDDKEKNELYHYIVEELHRLDIPIHLKTLIQVDSFRPCLYSSLNQRLNDEVLKGISLLQVLSSENSTSDHFADFKTTFTNRYEGEFVPLTEVLDTESGIGYGKFDLSGMEESPLIDKLTIGNGLDRSSLTSFSNTETFKWQLYQQAIADKKTEMWITEKMIDQLSSKSNASGLAHSICTMAKIHASSHKEIDKGNYRITLQAPSGPSGANLLGRFCHLHPDLEQLTSDILITEEAHHPDCIYAEIVHLPESRIGNILMRPALRKFEIPYLCGPSVKNDFQISVSDLLVGVENNKVVLRSKRLNKEIIPRLTTAHNYHLTTLPVYQFLCDLQYQGIRQVGWQWGVLEAQSFLPRISYGKFILSKARWILTKDDIKDFVTRNDDELCKRFSELRITRNIPRYILLLEGDNELLLDLENIFCLRLLINEINKINTVTVTETLDTPDQCWIESNDGKYSGEFIFSFSLKKEEVKKQIPNLFKLQVQPNTQRIFPVGSEWLYAKIYCGTKTAEKLLANVLKPFTEDLLSENIIDKFFFLRYHDTAHHIRIRFHNSVKKDFWKEVISRLQSILQPYFKSHLVHNLQFETYIREVERYGFDTIELSETVFWHQSESVFNLISLLSGDEGEQYRWQVALKAVDNFLDDFSYSPEKKFRLIKSLNKYFSDEFKIGTVERKKISEKFTHHKQLLNFLMTDQWQKDENFTKAIDIFINFNSSYHRTIDRILHSPSVISNPDQLDHLMQSYLHMLINRIFVSNHRKTELIIYEYLWRYYESKLMRKRNELSIPEPLIAVK